MSLNYTPFHSLILSIFVESAYFHPFDFPYRIMAYDLKSLFCIISDRLGRRVSRRLCNRTFRNALPAQLSPAIGSVDTGACSAELKILSRLRKRNRKKNVSASETASAMGKANHKASSPIKSSAKATGSSIDGDYETVLSFKYLLNICVILYNYFL